MKKLFPIFAAACFIAACSGNSSNTDVTDSTSTSTSPTTSSNADTAASASATDMSNAANSAAMKDGVMAMKGGKMMVMKNGNWEQMSETVTCTNGVKVTTKGAVTKGSRKKTLTEGMMIDKDGQLTDANGKLVDNAGW